MHCFKYNQVRLVNITYHIYHMSHYYKIIIKLTMYYAPFRTGPIHINWCQNSVSGPKPESDDMEMSSVVPHVRTPSLMAPCLMYEHRPWWRLASQIGSIQIIPHFWKHYKLPSDLIPSLKYKLKHGCYRTWNNKARSKVELTIGEKNVVTLLCFDNVARDIASWCNNNTNFSLNLTAIMYWMYCRSKHINS